MLYLPISRNWLVSRTAHRVYIGCSVLSVALAATIMAVRAGLAAARFSALTPDAAAIVRLLLFPEIVGAALLWVGMRYRSHFLKKALWFVALALFAPL